MKQDKTKPIFGLKKIPNKILLKMALVENGKLKAYIDELEYELKKREQGTSQQEQPELTDEELRAIQISTRKEEMYKQLKAMNKDLWERNKKLKNRLDDLLSKMLQNKDKTVAKCFYCGHELIWGNDWSLSDVEGTEEENEEDGIVSSYTCPFCGAHYTVTQRNSTEEKGHEQCLK